MTEKTKHNYQTIILIIITAISLIPMIYSINIYLITQSIINLTLFIIIIKYKISYKREEKKNSGLTILLVASIISLIGLVFQFFGYSVALENQDQTSIENIQRLYGLFYNPTFILKIIGIITTVTNYNKKV